MNNVYYLTAIISFIRHGEKDNLGALTSKGKLQAAQKGAQSKFLKGNIHVRHSGVDRVKKTAQTFAQFLPLSEQDLTHLTVDNLIEAQTGDPGVNDPTSEIDQLHYMLDPVAKSEYFEEWKDTLNREEKIKVVDTFLTLKDKLPQDKNIPSPKMMAQRLVNVLLTELEQVKETPPDQKDNFINVSHEPVLISTLYYLLQDCEPTLENFAQQIGGSIDFAEGFDINVYETNTREIRLFLEFREMMKPLSVRRLEAFVK